jgi:hypothetical protein
MSAETGSEYRLPPITEQEPYSVATPETFPVDALTAASRVHDRLRRNALTQVVPSAEPDAAGSVWAGVIIGPIGRHRRPAFSK